MIINDDGKIMSDSRLAKHVRKYTLARHRKYAIADKGKDGWLIIKGGTGSNLSIP